MKRILLIASSILLIASSALLLFWHNKTPNYYEQMTVLEEPIQLKDNLISKGTWVTHELVLNEQETLYYAPRKIRIDNNIYLNDKEVYIIVNKSGIFTSYEIPTDSTLKEIFQE